jgi:hypothetical protein
MPHVFRNGGAPKAKFRKWIRLRPMGDDVFGTRDSSAECAEAAGAGVTFRVFVDHSAVEEEPNRVTEASVSVNHLIAPLKAPCGIDCGCEICPWVETSPYSISAGREYILIVNNSIYPEAGPKWGDNLITDRNSARTT